jgi:hypothetical protein
VQSNHPSVKGCTIISEYEGSHGSAQVFRSTSCKPIKLLHASTKHIGLVTRETPGLIDAEDWDGYHSFFACLPTVILPRPRIFFFIPGTKHQVLKAEQEAVVSLATENWDSQGDSVTLLLLVSVVWLLHFAPVPSPGAQPSTHGCIPAD